MKYIISNLNEVIMFSDTLVHADVARVLRGEPTSAGFVEIEQIAMTPNGYEDRVRCYGESVTLNLKSNGSEDQKKIERHLKNHGY